MSAPQHTSSTPGPWEAAQIPGSTEWHVYKDDEIPHTLATLDGRHKRREANARLMARAPELLALLSEAREVLVLLADEVESNRPEDWEDCGCCGGCHPPSFAGDCRSDHDRWPADAAIERLIAERRQQARALLARLDRALGESS